MPRNVVIDTLGSAWTALESINAPMAVVGGLALAAWGHVRATQDIDLLISIDRARAQELLDRLQPLGFRTRKPMIDLGDMRLVQLKYVPAGTFLEVNVDLLLAQSEYHRTALDRRVATRLPGLEVAIAVLSPEDLILHKLVAARIIDLADCVALLQANRNEIDREYLRGWAEKLGRTSELVEVWSRAFPADASTP